MLLFRLHVGFIDLFKLKAYKLIENSYTDLSWLFFFFKEANMFNTKANKIGAVNALECLVEGKSNSYKSTGECNTILSAYIHGIGT